jgi:hypothetical protein
LAIISAIVVGLAGITYVVITNVINEKAGEIGEAT